MVSKEEKASSIRAVGLTAAVLVGVASLWGAATIEHGGGIALICSPLLLGALAGACAPERPIRAAGKSVVVATAVMALGLGLDVSWIMLLVFVMIVWALPTAILGAICGATVRRRARRVTP